MPRNYERNHIREAAILNSLPGTQGQIVERTGISQAAVSRWCERLVTEGKMHYLRYARFCDHARPFPVYELGPKPPGARVKKPKFPTQKERNAARWARLKRTGEAQDVYARRKALRAIAARLPVDPLMQAFYGAPK